MGGSSKKQTVGFKYSLGGQVVFFEGHADKLLRIDFLDGDKRKTAWTGSSGPGRISVNKPKLFGGEKKQGGVVGDFDFEDGAPTQVANDYLVSKLGALINAARRVTQLVLRRPYIGTNPYLKPISGRWQRIHIRTGYIEQWYDAKAAIPLPAVGSYSSPVTDTWSYKVVPAFGGGSVGVPSLYIARLYDDSDWESGPGPFGSYVGSVGTYVGSTEDGQAIWLRRRISGMAGDVTITVPFRDDGVWIWFNGVMVTSIGGLPSGSGDPSSVTIPAASVTGDDVIVVQVLNSIPSGTADNIYVGVSVDAPGDVQNDMNPAHIIREVETDTQWGSGLPESEVDDDYFTASADTLYDEGFGLSILWRQQGQSSDFVDQILRHIDAVRRVDRSTGKLQIKLIRADYDPESILVLDAGDIVEVEDLSRPQPGELVTTLTVVYWDRDTSKNASVTVHNPALIQQLGREIPSTVEYPAVTRRDLALRIALRDLKTLSYPLLAGRFTAKRKAAQLNLGDPFILKWPRLGVESAIMRVVDIGLGDGVKNTVSIQAAEDVFSLPTNVYITPVAGDWESPVSAPAPSPARLVIEAPYLEIVQQRGQTDADADLAAMPEAGYLMVAAQRPSDDAINAEIQVDSGAGYAEGGTLDFCPVAALAEDIGPTDTVVVLTGAVDVDALEVGSLAQLGDELVRLDAISDTAATIGRGVLDTVPTDHAAGEILWGIDLFADSDFTQYVEGETLSVKVLPATGEGELDIADAPADSLTMAARAIRPYPPADVRLNGDSFPATALAPVEVTWVTRNRLQQTSGTLVDWFDGPVTPETGQTATIRLLDGTTEVEAWTGEADGTVTLATVDTGTYTLEASSQRDGYNSFQAFMHEFFLIGTDALFTDDGEVLETDDGLILTE